jgi:multidrug efflux pump subunit AcrA (membrane-fusion protein)
MLATLLLVTVGLVAGCREEIGKLANWAGQDAPLRLGENGHEALTASGIVQAHEVMVSSIYGGRVAELTLSEGDTVSEGELVARLDTAVLDAQIEAAAATVEVARAALAQAQAGARPGEIAVARARVAQAETGQAVARKAVSDTQLLLDSPQQLDLEIATTQAELATLQHELDRALALKDDAQRARDHAQNVLDTYGYEGGEHMVTVARDPLGNPIRREVEINIPYKVHLAYIPWWKAWVGVNALQARREGVAAELHHLQAVRQAPQDLTAALDEAQSTRQEAAAQVLLAQAAVDRLEAGAAPSQIAALEARVAQAVAARDALVEERDLRQITAPLDGLVLETVTYEGEVASPGGTLLIMADLQPVMLTLYVPQTRIGQVVLGQPVGVAVDSFDGRVFQGEVTRIADEAEFTPRNVATTEERATLVFAVEVTIPNDDGALKPGMPADATFGPLEEAAR